jgi:hypothetical protein
MCRFDSLFRKNRKTSHAVEGQRSAVRRITSSHSQSTHRYLSFPSPTPPSLCTFANTLYVADSTAEMENGFTSRSFSSETSVSPLHPILLPLYSSLSLSLPSPLPLSDDLQKPTKTTPFVEQALTLMVCACENARKTLFSLVPSASLALVDWLGQLFPSGAARYLYFIIYIICTIKKY